MGWAAVDCIDKEQKNTVLEITVSIQTLSDHFSILIVQTPKKFVTDIWSSTNQTNINC